MNICVYGASSSELDPVYRKAVYELGKEMGLRGHTLVFGAGDTGMMGAAAHGITDAGGRTIGIAPRFFDEPGVLFPSCSEMIFTETMRERKLILEVMSDGFIVAPGGVGTMDEFFEMWTLRMLGRTRKPIAMLNVNGYYDELLTFLKKAMKERFFQKDVLQLLFVSDDIKAVLDYVTTQSSGQETHITQEEKQ